WHLGLCILVSIGAIGCGKSTGSVTVKSLSASGANALTLSVFENARQNLLLEGSAEREPKVDGLKVTLVNGIDLCTGTYGVDGECEQLADIDDALEVDLTGDVNAQAAITDVKSIPAGTYTHARVGIGKSYAIKAYYATGGNVTYTTASGLVTTAGSTPPAASYDYLEIPDLYPLLDSPSYQETTYFEEAFV